MLFKNSFGGEPAAVAGSGKLANKTGGPAQVRPWAFDPVNKSLNFRDFVVLPSAPSRAPQLFRYQCATIAAGPWTWRQLLECGGATLLSGLRTSKLYCFRILLAFAPLVAVCFLTLACQSIAPRLPPANLSESGWTIHLGQAVWHLPKTHAALASPKAAVAAPATSLSHVSAGGREIAGDVLLATKPDSEVFIQFSKTPFTLVTAQSTAQAWRVEFPPQNKHYSGRGAPPKRLLWLYLPRALSNKTLPAGLSWHEDTNGWRLANSVAGESLEGYFTQ